MSFQFMPLYTGDYLRDTRHLTPLRHGIYLLFLIYCWDQKGPLPLDEQECAGIANCRSNDEFDAMQYIRKRYFVEMADGWYSKRLQAELDKASALTKNRSEWGKKGAKNRWDSQTIAKPWPTHSLTMASATTPTPTPTTTTTKKAKQCREVARKILELLNEKTGRNYRPVPANLDLITARLREGATETQCRWVIAKKIQDWLGDEKMCIYLRPATLFNRTKFAQYSGEIADEEKYREEVARENGDVG